MKKGGAGPGEEGLPGYVECHFCTVRKKRRSFRCLLCVGRQSIRERLVRAAEEPIRRRLASFLSLLVPGLGHAYRSGPGTGLFHFLFFAAVVAFYIVIKGEMTSGRWFLIAALFVVYVALAVDAGRARRETGPPCQEACPARLACRQYVNLIEEGKFGESLELVQLLCPLPGTVGRVCHHPCERDCRRGEEGEAIAICSLKRFLADNASAAADSFFSGNTGSEVFKEKIAVVGGGPSGLSAALYLRLLGFPVTIFEAGEKVGGMPRAVIPDYRLPDWVYREEIDRILSVGIEVRTGRRLGEDFTLGDLKEEGFAGVYLALGAQKSIRLPHCGTPEEGFLDGLEFLRAAKDGTAGKLSGNVLVIGGGNVAVDVAKTAVRLGADTVRKIFLEARETMPAHRWECEEAVEEGVKLIPSSATVSFEKKNGRVSSALCRRVERIDFDEKGRIRPVLWEDSDFVLEADWVITAVGNGPDYSALAGVPTRKPLRGGVRLGRLPAGETPGIPVFIGGDYFAGPASVIEAIAAGHEAALAIYRVLHKFSFFRLPVWNRIRPVKYAGYRDGPEKALRRHPVKVDPDVRCGSFCEICESYDTEVAVEEASRCLRCGWPMLPVKRRRVPRVMVPEVPETPFLPDTDKTR